MIEVFYKGRLGNNMFQYALGRIIAEQKGYALKSTPIELFSETYTPVTGIVTHENPMVINSNFWIDYDNIINHTGKIYLDTYGQRVCYYEPHLDKIKNWFKNRRM